MRTSLAFLLVLLSSSSVSAQYLIEVRLPVCDPASDEVKIITGPSDWEAINDPRYRIFCVQPGDHSTVSVRLTADGTPERPRYLLYHGSGGTGALDTHPVRMEQASQAVIEELTFDGADHWVVHGLVIDGGDRLSPSGTGVDLLDGSSHNVLDRLVIQHGAGTLVQIEHGASHNTLQNSVVRETQSDPARPSKDYHCIHLKGDSPGTIHNRIVRNEVYDCAGDSIHFSGCPYWLPDAHERGYDCRIDEQDSRFWGDARGTIIYDNDLYITNAFRDVCGGSCACMENAIDIKSTMGAADRAGIGPADWVRIERNRMWNDCDGSGDAVIAHFANSDYVLLRHNIIHHWRYGYRPTVKDDPYVDHHSIVGNVFAQSANVTSVSRVSRDLEFYKNVIVDISDDGHNLSGYGASDHIDMQCNAFIDAAGWSISEEIVHSDWNSFYASESFGSGPNDQSFASVDAARMQELCFERRLWTGPETHCIPNARPTAESPHVMRCPETLGSYPDVGVHDDVDPGFFTWIHEADRLTILGVSAVPASGDAPLEVRFTAEASGTHGSETYRWDFGDGAISSEPSPVHLFELPGRYVVELTLTDAAEAVTGTVEIEVGETSGGDGLPGRDGGALPPVAEADAGSPEGSSAPAVPESDSGCACRVAPAGPGWPAFLLAFGTFGCILLRARRRAP